MEIKGMEVISAKLGTRFCEVTTVHTNLKARAIVINTDAVFTTLTLKPNNGGQSYSALAAYNESTAPVGQNLAARTVSKGMVLYAPEGYYYSALTMSTGDCLLILG